MTTSGSVDFSANRDQIIQAAFRKLGVFDSSETIPGDDLRDAAFQLNAMIKEWLAGEGFKLWLREEVILILASGTQKYTIGPSGTAKATTTLVETEIATAASSGASSIVVDSITGISSADNIGIELDDGSIQWTTVNGAPSGSTVTLTDTLTDDVAVDNNVYVYTTGANRPQRIIYALRRDKSGNDTEVKIIHREEYLSLSSKSASGPVTQISYTPTLTNGELYVWPSTETSIHKLVLLVEGIVEDFDAAANTPDFPIEWVNALIWNLAAELAPDYDVIGSRYNNIKREAEKKKMLLEDYGFDEGSVHLGLSFR